MLSEELGLAFGKPPDHCEDSPGLEQGSQTTGPAAVGFVPKPDPLMVIAVPYVAEPDTPLTCGAATASCVTMPHANKSPRDSPLDTGLVGINLKMDEFTTLATPRSSPVGQPERMKSRRNCNLKRSRAECLQHPTRADNRARQVEFVAEVSSRSHFVIGYGSESLVF